MMSDIHRIESSSSVLAGNIVLGRFHHKEGSDMIIDLGEFLGTMPRREQVKNEDQNIGDSILCYVLSVKNEDSLSEMTLSQSHPNLVRRLFEAAVPEISSGTVEIRGLVREAGFRTKVAVWSNDKNVDPVKSCLGEGGELIKKIVSYLKNEKVDIIRWSDDQTKFVQRALKPAELESITLDQENKIIYVTVNEANLAKAIGRKGQNARLSSRLLGWDVKVQLKE